MTVAFNWPARHSPFRWASLAIALANAIYASVGDKFLRHMEDIGGFVLTAIAAALVGGVIGIVTIAENRKGILPGVLGALANCVAPVILFGPKWLQ